MTRTYTGAPQTFSFAAGESGEWAIDSSVAIAGDDLPPAPRLAFLRGPAPGDAVWALSGVTSNARYTTRQELSALVSEQAPLARSEARAAALIPIRKSPAWWALAQDERRRIMEESSHHIAIGREYLPAIARQLHHCRDLGGPFDFLTWFEFAPSDAPAFDELLARLRATEEWTYVEREIEVRVTR